jgi:Family of unknown function (DUF6345)
MRRGDVMQKRKIAMVTGTRHLVSARKKTLCVALLVSVFLLTGCPEAVHMYAINNWTTECGGSPRAWSNMMANWYQTMGDHGHILDEAWIDGNFNRSLVCDEHLGLSDCADESHADSAEFVMIGLHGGRSGRHWRGSLRRNGGPGVNDCNIDAPEGSSGEFYMGNGEAVFVHLSSCHSMDDDSMLEVWRLFQDPQNPLARPDKLHVITGFHGMMGVGGTYGADYRDFAEAANTISIKDAWMDTMYHPEMSNVKCPVAYSVGTGPADCFARIDNSTYQSYGSDPESIAELCYYYYDGCDPASEGPFTPPT